MQVAQNENYKQLSLQINYDVLKKLGSECDATIDRIRRDTETETVDIKPRQRYKLGLGIDVLQPWLVTGVMVNT